MEVVTLKLKQWGLICLLLLQVSLPALSQTRLGLHVTLEELNIWRNRLKTGPYKIDNDVSANSPGDWTRIARNAENFRLNQVKYRWAGPVVFMPAGSTYQGKSIAGAVKAAPGVENEATKDAMAIEIRDAAFVYLVDKQNPQRVAYKSAVKAELLYYSKLPIFDFTNTTKWPSNYYGDINPLFEIANWFTKLFLAYDYIDAGDAESKTSTFSLTERNQLDIWFLHAAQFMQNEQELDIDKIFTNRKTSGPDDDYTLGIPTAPSVRDGKTLVTHCSASGLGNVVYGIHQGFNNRRMACHRFACLAGIKLKNQILVDNAKRYFKDWIKYSMYPDGTVAEFERWNAAIPDLGWAYVTDIVGSAVTIADAIARTGDLSLFHYKTRIGKFTTISPNSDKSLYSILKVMTDITAKKVQWYGTNDLSKAGDPNFLIDGIVPAAYYNSQTGAKGGDWRGLHDVWFTMSNIYYKDPKVKAMYMRNGPKMDPYVPNATHGKYPVWMGDWGIYPGLLFMFGQLENVVSPHSQSLPDTLVQAEAVYSVKTDSGAKGAVSVASIGTTDEKSVNLLDLGDKIRINFNVSGGTYQLKVRLRSGYSNATGSNPKSYWPDGYGFLLDEDTATFKGDLSTISEMQTGSNGGYWGIMKSYNIALTQGFHFLDIEAISLYGGVDYLEIKKINNNLPPAADAGEDRMLYLPDNKITLTGSGLDNEGMIASYTWYQISGNFVDLKGVNSDHLILDGLEEGTYVFKLKVTDANGAYGFDDVSIIISPHQANNGSHNQGILYPNPVADHLNIKLNTFIDQSNLSFLIVDHLGKIFGEKTLSATGFEVMTEITDFKLKPGIYYLKVLINGDYKVFRFLKE